MKPSIRIAAVLCVIILGGAYLSAQEAATPKIDGTWVGRVGKQQYTFELKASGETLTGSVTPSGGQPINIEDGEIDGADFAFQTVEDGKTWIWTGYVDVNQIEGERETEKDDAFETFRAEMKR